MLNESGRLAPFAPTLNLGQYLGIHRSLWRLPLCLNQAMLACLFRYFTVMKGLLTNRSIQYLFCGIGKRQDRFRQRKSNGLRTNWLQRIHRRSSLENLCRRRRNHHLVKTIRIRCCPNKRRCCTIGFDISRKSRANRVLRCLASSTPNTGSNNPPHYLFHMQRLPSILQDHFNGLDKR